MTSPDNPYTTHGAEVPPPGAGPLAQAWLEVERLTRALASSNERVNRVQADGNRLADRLHVQATKLQAYREAFLHYGIPDDPEALRAALRHLVASVCVGECGGRCR